MGVHSGKFGVINGVSTVRNWSISDTLTNPKYAASNTRNGTGRITGIQSWSGSFGYYGILPPAMPGEFMSFLGYGAPDNDTLAGTGTTLAGSAIVDSIALTWNWKSGEILSQVLNFSGHLGLTWADAQTAISDSTAPDVNTICGTKIQYSSNGSDFTELTDITQATLTISAANQSYVNSSTGCTTGRKAGMIDWVGAITREDSKKVLVAGTNYVWRWFVDTDSYWALKWGKIKDFSNYNVNIESGEIISHVLNVEMNGFNAGTGFITKPDAGSPWWPI